MPMTMASAETEMSPDQSRRVGPFFLFLKLISKERPHKKLGIIIFLHKIIMIRAITSNYKTFYQMK